MEFPFMTFRFLRLLALLALVAAPAFVSAQETTASEDERIEQLVRSEASEWYTPKDSLRVGFRVLSSGANVRFGKLGVVTASASIAPASAGDRVARTYDNGWVGVDDPRAGETDEKGSQTSTPGGRYQTIVNGVVTTDYLSFTPGLTRTWGYSTPDQATEKPGYIAMSTYSATSDGASLSKKEGPSIGVELEFSHAFRKFGKRTEFSVTGGLAINGINTKTAGDVRSTLHTITDYYAYTLKPGETLPTTSPDHPYSGPSYSSDSKTETTIPIGSTASQHNETATSGGALVHGKWQVKGAYMMVRIGPSLRTQVTNSLGVSASAGLAGAYVGTHYSASESLEIPLMNKTVTDIITDSDKNKFLAGYYGDFNIEWNANDVVGLYGGVSAQKLGDYTQNMGARNALIDLGASVGFRGGLNIRF